METTRARDPFAGLGSPLPPGQAPVRQPTMTVRRTPVGRRLLGVAALLLLTAASIPVHVLAIFFVYVEIESPGDPVTAVLLIAAAVVASFLALLVTGTLAQLAGGFPGRWRARITFSVLSAVLAIAVAYFAAVTLFP